MAKNKTQKLSKVQLKKLKGGLIYCINTNCAGDTCGDAQGENRSKIHCQNSGSNTLGINSGGSSTQPKTKK